MSFFPSTKILRVFVSSVGQMMDVERDTLRDRIWKSGHFPIAMEGFSGNHSQTSIDVVLSNLKRADVIIFVLGYTYGNIIGDALKCKDCHLKSTCKNFRRKKEATCAVSYTHFEYMYAKKEKILHYCIVQQNIDNTNAFKARLISYFTPDEDVALNQVESIYFKHQSEYVELINEISSNNWTYFYDANQCEKIVSSIIEIYATIYNRLPKDMKEADGLIEGKSVLLEWRKKNEEINQLKKQLAEQNGIISSTLRQLHANQPTTAVTGTCIPFLYNSEDNTITSYFICNSAYSGKQRLMFPGGHAFVNDESPEAVAIAKALTEAGLEVKTVDLYNSFDMSSRSSKEITKNFIVYRPPHYCYHFKQGKDAKCYAEKNHHFHYDAVYVFEIVKTHSNLECSQTRVPIKLSNKILTTTSIREEIKRQIQMFNENREKHGETTEEVGDYVIQMLYEAHRDYVRYLQGRGEKSK